MSPSRSKSESYRTPAADGGALAFIPQQSQSPAMSSNQNNTPSLAVRRAEFEAMLQAAVEVTAGQIKTDLPPSLRSADESQFIFDCARGRRAASRETLAMLLALQARGESRTRHLLSDSIRLVEAKTAPSPICVFEASEREEATNGPLNIAQQVAAKEKSPTRWAQVRDFALVQVHATLQLVDAAAQHVRG